MPWSQQQKEDILELFWQNGTARCPDDNSVLMGGIQEHPAGYFLSAKCPRCNQSVHIDKQQDPRAASFRPWSDQEKEAMVNDVFQQNRITCPVDGTTVKGKILPAKIGSLVTLVCPRCGNYHNHSFA